MGLYINHLRTVSFETDRTLYVYLLDYGWPDGEWEQIFKRHFMKMADMASETGAVIVGSPSGVHFANEVLNWHRVGSLSADDMLPGLLITKTPPHYFQESHCDSGVVECGLEEMLCVAIGTFCTTETEFVQAIESVFKDLEDGAVLNDFKIAEHNMLKRTDWPLARRIGEAIELKPGALGFQIDLKRLLFNR